ncbi:FAD-dependent oxidoreductase [Mesorhizobium silamurunense]|uniref:FAD-dependent oxidoreductase n=1 Tax=Mesorhizobium silamurunense TaxID=499528 RepID=UPI0017862426|nr:FAD-dependent oxidoreductase [Mesorhizobium silamurunense]
MTQSGVGSVVAIWRYPVSSLAGEKLPRAHITERGLSGDRQFAIIDTETQETVQPAKKVWGRVPRLLSRQDPEDGQVLVSLDGKDWLHHDDPQLWKQLSTFLGRHVSVQPYGAKLKDRIAQHRYSLSPIHLLSRQALDALKRILPGSIIDERRFRPNVVVDLKSEGGKPPELNLLGQEFSIGNLRLRGTQPCGRCSFTTLEQFGVPEDRSVLRTLITQYGKNFGIYCEVLNEGWLELGDEVVADLHSAPSSIVIVGAGQAGGSTARVLRECGYEGSIALFGDEPHPPYERPPLSKNFAVDRDQPALTSVLTSAEAEAMNVNVHLRETVVHIDRSKRIVETASGMEYPYDRLVLATGGTARRLAKLDRGYGRIHYIRTADDAERLRRAFKNAASMFVLGSGWLGLEVAAAVRKNSIDVTLFGRDARLCAKALPEVAADYLERVHVENGVRFVLGKEPRFTEHADHVEVVYDGKVEKADLFVVAIGIVANDHLARRAGLDCRDGILTDTNGATSDPEIFAVGDVSRQSSSARLDGIRLESWQNATEQASRAAHAMLGRDGPSLPLPRFWSDQYDITIHIAGMPDPSAIPQSADDGPYPFWQFENFAIGVNRPREVHQFAISQEQASVGKLNGNGSPGEKPAAKGTRRHLPDMRPLREGQLERIHVEPIGEIVVARVGDEYFGLQDRCPHAEASLSEGFLEGRRLVCPLHFAEFDLATGTPYNAPKGCSKARSFLIEPQGDQFFIWVPDAG